jgi:hypothetical protein
VFPGTSAADGATTTGATTETTDAGGADATTSTVATVTTAPADALSVIDGFDWAAVPSLPDAEVPPSSGVPDDRAAAAITADIAGAGIDLTGVEFWVLPVSRSDERLLVIEISDAAFGLLEDPSGESLFDAILDAPSVAEAGATRLVINYRGADAEGPFVLTSTVELDVLASAYAEARDLGEGEMLLQFSRNGAVVEP